MNGDKLAMYLFITHSRPTAPLIELQYYISVNVCILQIVQCATGTDEVFRLLDCVFYFLFPFYERVFRNSASHSCVLYPCRILY